MMIIRQTIDSSRAHKESTKKIIPGIFYAHKITQSYVKVNKIEHGCIQNYTNDAQGCVICKFTQTYIKIWTEAYNISHVHKIAPEYKTAQNAHCTYTLTKYEQIHKEAHKYTKLNRVQRVTH